MSDDLKYKKGDRVVIKPWKLMEAEYGIDDRSIDTRPWLFTPHMEKLLAGTDRVRTIDEVRCDCYITQECRDIISDNHILGYAFDWGEEIEVSNDGENWDMARFVAYDPGFRSSVACMQGNMSCSNKFARPIRKPQIDVVIKINGKDATPDDISEETAIKAVKKWLGNTTN